MTSPSTEVRAEDQPMAPVDWSILAVISSIWGASFLFMAIGLESFEPGSERSRLRAFPPCGSRFLSKLVAGLPSWA